ncbi:unnamed protein product [Amoebophrya sp. A25]|nr:unnamed protein product [Amoebophrya sp. A25]|eukprot:GSA25T00017644001.1
MNQCMHKCTPCCNIRRYRVETKSSLFLPQYSGNRNARRP